MTLNTKQKQDLKAKAHALKPVVLIGEKGVTPAVMKEIEGAIAHHELIKIRIASNDRDERREMIQAICEAASAELVQIIGSIGVLYRKSKSEAKPVAKAKSNAKPKVRAKRKS